MALRVGTRRELVRRALFGINAARRIARDVVSGTSVSDALGKERSNFEAHRVAQARRLRVDDVVEASRRLYGRILGWNLGPNENHCLVCRRLAGHNFDAENPPPEGKPGSVHPNCKCYPGPAFP